MTLEWAEPFNAITRRDGGSRDDYLRASLAALSKGLRRLAATILECIDADAPLPSGAFVRSLTNEAYEERYVYICIYIYNTYRTYINTYIYIYIYI